MRGIGQQFNLGLRYRGTILTGLVVAAATALAAGAANLDPKHQSKYSENAVPVSFKPEASETERSGSLARLGLSLDHNVRNPYFTRVKLGAAARRAGVKAMIRELRKDQNVGLVEPDYTVHSCAIPNDSLHNEQWALNNVGQTFGTSDADIDATEAWDKTTGSTSVIVAVIDTGVDYMHPDLSPNIMRDGLGNVIGYDFADYDPDPLDE